MDHNICNNITFDEVLATTFLIVKDAKIKFTKIDKLCSHTCKNGKNET